MKMETSSINFGFYANEKYKKKNRKYNLKFYIWCDQPKHFRTITSGKIKKIFLSSSESFQHILIEFWGEV